MLRGHQAGAGGIGAGEGWAGGQGGTGVPGGEGGGKLVLLDFPL